MLPRQVIVHPTFDCLVGSSPQPGLLSVCAGFDHGLLDDDPREEGFAHLLEHLWFHASSSPRYVGWGETRENATLFRYRVTTASVTEFFEALNRHITSLSKHIINPLDVERASANIRLEERSIGGRRYRGYPQSLIYSALRGNPDFRALFAPPSASGFTLADALARLTKRWSVSVVGADPRAVNAVRESQPSITVPCQGTYVPTSRQPIDRGVMRWTVPGIDTTGLLWVWPYDPRWAGCAQIVAAHAQVRLGSSVRVLTSEGGAAALRDVEYLFAYVVHAADASGEQQVARIRGWLRADATLRQLSRQRPSVRHPSVDDVAAGLVQEELFASYRSPTEMAGGCTRETIVGFMAMLESRSAVVLTSSDSLTGLD